MSQTKNTALVFGIVAILSIVLWMSNSAIVHKSNYATVSDDALKIKSASSENRYFLGDERVMLNSDELDLTIFTPGSSIADLLLDYPFENKSGLSFDRDSLERFSGKGLFSKYGGIAGNSIIAEIKDGVIEEVRLP